MDADQGLRSEGKRPLNKEDAFLVIVDDILSNRLLPGQPLVERVLAQRFQLSRTPIREILRRLERDRLVDVYPNQGVFVRRQSPKDIQDLFQLRIALEPIAASLSATNRPDDELRDIEQKFELHCGPETGDAKALIALGESLHDAVVRWTGNALLVEMYELLRKQTKLVRGMMQKRKDLERESFKEHMAILVALKERDSAAAERRMREHLWRANKDIVEWLTSGDAPQK